LTSQGNTVAAPNGNTEWLYGVHSVAEALRAGRRRFMELYLLRDHESRRLDTLAELGALRAVPIKVADAGALTRLCGSGVHQGAVLCAGPYPLLGFESLLAAASSPDRPLFLMMLDSIQDPHNLGAILRTAVCAGIDGLVVHRHRFAPVGPTVSRVSAGALEHATVYQVTNLADTITRLQKETHLWVVGLEHRSPRSIFEASLTGHLALVVGGEEKGLRQLVRKRCDDLVSIPQRGPIESLNASAASAVGLFEAVRQRTPGLQR
jgi:23S rRNA (guanosine2251-2'-O)-methyltransferase